MISYDNAECVICTLYDVIELDKYDPIRLE